jgi:hypothetical protein
MPNKRREFGALLWNCLGSSPFRLRKLDLTGLYAHSLMTLDRIIDIHASSLRNLLLPETDFRWPNTLRAFFSSLGRTDINLFGLRSLLINQDIRFAICRYNELICEEDPECLAWDGSKDVSYKGWVNIVRGRAPADS